ncbi:hypothetical protein TSOC_000840 [Tetrabaena socialis]|uniref:Sulfatase-modifying factor enzyme domain-containing protein n=1 Tax=Tetrabaena socialis TaxID=47790 RepID=A0A2J8AIB8_9CHLO|nr:hypothetical protein TSOC_000840 [Tetrabaena socialis]|eukprot:PNH12258.1 hypothetical protein TSOC_000840 [Tetrabaena socialis]
MALRVDMGACRNPSLNIRPDLARAATAITGPSVDDELVGARGAWWWTGKHPDVGGCGYKLRVLFDAIDMRWDWPVDANYHEARAFAAWRTEQDGAAVRYRLSTEAEHNLLRNDRDRVDAHLLAPADHAALLAEPLRPAGANERVSPDACMEVAGHEALASPAGGFNIQLAYGSQSPVTELPPSAKGFHDTMGNAWEWGEDHYAAFAGFKLHPFYEDFSAPCFAGKHQLIMGGSFISTGQLASKFARYQFRPHFFQHATFRLVQTDVDLSLYDCERYGTHNPVTPFYETSCMDCAPPYAGDGPCCSVSRRTACTPTAVEEAASTKAKLEAAQVAYENDAVLAQYLSLHYGPVDRVYPDLARETGVIAEALDFPRKLAECLNGWAERAGLLAPASASAGGAEAGACAEASGSGRGAAAGPRALDLGCAVGRSSFEMARVFREVVGVDISKTFIEVAAKIRDNGRMDYECLLEGEITERLTAALPAASGAEGAPAAINTSRCRFVQAPAGSADALKALLAPDFDILEEGSMPLLIREHGRKYQLINAHKLVLQRKQ